MSVKPETLLGNIKIAHVFHHPVQALNMNFNPHIYIIYYQTNLLNYLPPNPVSYPYKMKYLRCWNRQCANLVNITSWRYVNDVTQMSINKERYWLTLTFLRLEARSRSRDISMFCIKKCKQPEMLVSSMATTLRM